jgi:outer membrane receptor protein involved in Fe transport
VASASASYQRSFAEAELALPPGARDHRDLQPAYAIIDARISWTPNNRKVTLSVWGQTLGSEGVCNDDVGADFGEGRIYGPPRTYGTRVDDRF